MYDDQLRKRLPKKLRKQKQKQMKAILLKRIEFYFQLLVYKRSEDMLLAKYLDPFRRKLRISNYEGQLSKSIYDSTWDTSHILCSKKHQYLSYIYGQIKSANEEINHPIKDNNNNKNKSPSHSSYR